ncbi:MAG TPA: acyl-CoA dehydrogenase [Acidobacteriota bacterium]|nr:acyl-CoA dehydrogenase [Acidobacteriota bacterium]
MDFDFSEEEEMLQQMVREFAENEVRPIASEIDQKGRFPVEVIRKAAELGLTGIGVPQQYGGAGLTSLATVIAIEEISRCCASTGVILSVNNSLVCDPLLKFGSEEQKQRILKPLASGEALGCFALTEPQAGSDASNLRATAVLQGEEYVVNGQKVWITNAPDADWALVFCMTNPPEKHKGITALMIHKDTPGFSVGRHEEKMGIRAAVSASLDFENCRVAAANRIGNEGDGFKVALATLDGGRIGIAAQAVGIAQGAFDAALQYAKQRTAFGQLISTFQAIQWMLSDMATEIDAARLMTYRAALAKDSGKRYSKLASMAKLFASETAMKHTVKAVQIHGGYGYSKEFPVERAMRDAKITELYEGTSEIQRLVIAQSILSSQ